MESILEVEETFSPELDKIIGNIKVSDSNTGNDVQEEDIKLDILDLEATDVEPDDDYEEPIVHRREVKALNTFHTTHAAKKIWMQPEMKLLMLEKQREKEKLEDSSFHQDQQSSITLTETQQTMLRRFPWLADKMKTAWDDLKEDETGKGSGKVRSGVKQASKFSTVPNRPSMLKSRGNKPFSILRKQANKAEDGPGEAKVVFSRNVPILVYNKENKKCIKLGGDRPNEKISFEEIYRAVNFNPELKKVTLDLEDLRHPEKERTLRLAMSYISANTVHNAYVLTDDMCKFSYKKEQIIKIIVEEIERRLLRQKDKRDERQERQRVQDEEMRQQKEEEEVRGRDFITANRLLEKSKAVDSSILTNFEKKQERKRRIRLRTKSMQTSQRADMQVRQRKVGVAHIEFQPHPGADV